MPVVLLALAAVGGFLWWKHKQGDDSSPGSDSGTTPATGTGDPMGTLSDTRYPPNDPATIDLFTQAAMQAGVPPDWASDPDLHSILKAESNGWVGIPNYQFGALSSPNRASDWPTVWNAIRNGTWRTLIDANKYPHDKQSSATGLGQLTLSNIPTYYPSGVDGIGIAIEEAIGMLKYIADGHAHPKFDDPASAWAFHQANNWY